MFFGVPSIKTETKISSRKRFLCFSVLGLLLCLDVLCRKNREFAPEDITLDPLVQEYRKSAGLSEDRAFDPLVQGYRKGAIKILFQREFAREDITLDPLVQQYRTGIGLLEDTALDPLVQRYASLFKIVSQRVEDHRLMPSSTNSPCAACKFLRRKCIDSCIFSPYFPPDQPERFESVHRIFGASNVGKLLSDLPPVRRKEAADCLVYEARARMQDPLMGCVRLVYLLERELSHLNSNIEKAKQELANYIGHAAFGPLSPFPVFNTYNDHTSSNPNVEQQPSHEFTHPQSSIPARQQSEMQQRKGKQIAESSTNHNLNWQQQQYQNEPLEYELAHQPLQQPRSEAGRHIMHRNYDISGVDIRNIFGQTSSSSEDVKNIGGQSDEALYYHDLKDNFDDT